jgi:hypothetical protein
MIKKPWGHRPVLPTNHFAQDLQISLSLYRVSARCNTVAFDEKELDLDRQNEKNANARKTLDRK